MAKLFSLLLFTIAILSMPTPAFCQNSSHQEAREKWLAALNKVVEKQKEIDAHVSTADPRWLVEDPYLSLSGRRWALKLATLQGELLELNKIRGETLKALKIALAPYDEFIKEVRKTYQAILRNQELERGHPDNICRALRAIETDLAKILTWTGLDSVQTLEQALKNSIEIGEKLQEALRNGQTPDRIFRDLEDRITKDPALKGIIGEYGSFLKIYGDLSVELLAQLPEKERTQKLIEMSGKVAKSLVVIRNTFKAAALLENLVRESSNPFGSKELEPLISLVDLTNELLPETLGPIKGYLAFTLAVLETFGPNIEVIKLEEAKKNLVALYLLSEDPTFRTAIGGMYHSAPFGRLVDAASCSQLNSIAGIWQSNYGPVSIRQSPIKGREVVAINGSWDQEWQGNKITKQGVIESGRFDPVTGKLEFSFFQGWNKERGTASLKLSPDGKRLEGPWKHGSSSGIWAMSR